MTGGPGWVGGPQGPRSLCVLAPNPGPMTLDGTNTWVLRGTQGGPSVVIDPGPLDEAHLDAVAVAAGDTAAVLLTHGHLDHSAAARRMAERLRCGVRALDPALRLGGEGLGAGDVVALGDAELRVIATPGHTSDSLSFVLEPDGALLTGDTVLGRGTSVVAYPDGSLGPYLDSLRRLRDLAAERGLTAIWPGHGPVLADPLAVLDGYLAHRAERLDQVRAALAAGDRTPHDVVRRVYADVDPVLWPAAELSVRAQLDYLAES